MMTSSVDDPSRSSGTELHAIKSECVGFFQWLDRRPVIEQTRVSAQQTLGYVVIPGLLEHPMKVSAPCDGIIVSMVPNGQPVGYGELLFEIQPDEPQMEPKQAEPTVDIEVESEGEKRIVSPLDGKFYSASSPGGTPYVTQGDHVRVGTVLCIVEAMKLLNQVESDVDGIIANILLRDGDEVKAGQPLFSVRPSSDSAQDNK